MTKLERLNTRKARVQVRLDAENAKDTPRAERVSRITNRLATIQTKIDAI